MHAVVAPASQQPDATSAPQLRTLLLTDLVDSTGLVERLGDGPAAALFREHDALVLALQQRWRGRLIDRSDGLLLLFERAIDGLGFALDYARGLRELGAPRKVVLQARAGLHVGEVLTWRNSDEAVSVGAKPLEVEGLAKPLAGRLMSLARPGQILLSATAEPLARRAARELGERGEQLLWKSHGRWRLKGVPEAQELYEVGEAGLAPLRAPKAGPKAWRDIPLWRRPAALAAELLLAVGLATGAWFVTRPQPAIAFGERDWVVMGDLRNLTGQTVLDDSLQQAFRISLEQSRHVNVLSDLKARDTLARMQLPAGTALDRAVASEVAVRDGVRAVILPTVAEVGGRVRVSAEVIDPHTQTTVYAEYADGNGLDSVLASVDDVTAALRARLGEEIKAIERDSEPLPQVTTSNLDALRAYALGVKAQAMGDVAAAIRFYATAIELDREFALAHLGLARNYSGADDMARAKAHVSLATGLKDRLPPRDGMYVDAWNATFGPVEPMLQKWANLWKLYPDYYAGPANYSLFSALHANRFAGIMEAATAATDEKNPLRGWAFYNRAGFRAAVEDFAAAEEDFRTANAMGVTGTGLLQANTAAAQREFKMAEQILATAQGFSSDSGDFDRRLASIVHPLDQGRWQAALEAAGQAASDAREISAFHALTYRVIELSIRGLSGNNAGLRSALAQLIDAAQTAMAEGNCEPHEAGFVILSAGYIGARASVDAIPERALALAGGENTQGYPVLGKLDLLLRAEVARNSGDLKSAIDLLGQKGAGEELYQLHAIRMDAFETNGDFERALEEARWLIAHRGRAYMEYGSGYALQAMNVIESNRARLAAARHLHRLGKREQAESMLASFDRYWPAEVIPPGFREMREEVYQ